MGLRDVKVIDAIGIEKDTGSVILTMADACDWSDEEQHLRLFLAKMDTYLRFIETGEILDTLPQAACSQVIILWATKFPLPPLGEHLIERAREIVESIGLQLRHEHFAEKDT